MRRIAFSISALLFAPIVFAQDGSTVLVPSERAVLWPYRLLGAGLTAFERHRELAPQADLRFKLRARGAESDNDVVSAGISMALVGNGWETPIEMAANGRFIVPPSERAEDEDAQLVISGKRERYDTTNSPRVEVRTPGMAHNAVRLGDLRLECQVNQAIAKKLFGFVRTMALNALGGSDWCSPRTDNAGYAVTAARPFTKAELVEGPRRVTLHAGAARTSLTAPLRDESWSNDALIELTAP